MPADWVPYVTLGLAAANVIMIPVLNYAINSRMRDHVREHNDSPLAHGAIVAARDRSQADSLDEHNRDPTAHEQQATIIRLRSSIHDLNGRIQKLEWELELDKQQKKGNG